MKYNVGDKVVIRPDLCRSHGSCGAYPVDDMIAMAGQMVTIRDKSSSSYRIKESGYNWTDEMFMQKVEETKGFTKKDLKPGYVVILRSGKEFVVMNAGSAGDIPYLVHPTGSGENLLSFNEDLTCKCSESNDIVKVYGCSSSLYEILTTKTASRRLLWERQKPVVELTMDQIAKLAGVDVKNLKIKK